MCNYLFLQLIFVFVDLDNEDAGKPVADYFGVTGSAPQVISSSPFNII